MKKEISFYEFVALLVPACIFLMGSYFLLQRYEDIPVLNFSSLSETAIFLIICYGFGHIIQSLGNLFEKFIWWIYGGLPTKWLSNKNRFGNHLLKGTFNDSVLQKVQGTFGIHEDYGRLVYNKLFQENKCARIDIFNGNYSLFRGLSVTFLLLAVGVSYYCTWKFALPAFIPFVLLTRRMILFATYYATETFITFYNS